MSERGSTPEDVPASLGSREDEALDPEERALFERAADDRAAREALVIRHRPLAEYLARRFQGRGEPVDDLVQVAMIGLLKAIDRFDTDRGVKFSTYATATIVGELKRHFRDRGWGLRVPRRLQETGLLVNQVVSELSQTLGRSPTIAEIARRAGLEEDEVIEGIEVASAYAPASLDAPSPEGESPHREPSVEEEDFERLEGWAAVAPAIRELPARERRILYLRFFRDMTQTEIAREIGISQMHVSRLLAKTLAWLREQVDPGAFG
ncbi:MAG TPA: SigB/SigF/SigG family RNA polymerase sigma factor [Actinomycetota bacterium]|nr:SigB/SigF/SigG family RNA polymerase sigma factor [Actinomycetota bacterium]